ncbi:DUF1187 family protein [uncultured Chryseobacterium sp.]|uniref:DUF1187 family protein n=1 Tax=uncultured Chryseobacterium sp. TaxID=259322 RepID=UPI00338FFCD1
MYKTNAIENQYINTLFRSFIFTENPCSKRFSGRKKAGVCEKITGKLSAGFGGSSA